MKFNFKMPKGLEVFYQKEIEEYKLQLSSKQMTAAWMHLENAHVLGQLYPLEHTYAHWLMLKFGFKTKNTKEIIGQLPRLLVGGVKSFVGKVPTGNTGGVNVPPLLSMEIPKELKDILTKNQ